MTNLNALYRQQGWGQITDQAFKGELAPLDVESQAREVARFAFLQRQEFMAVIEFATSAACEDASIFLTHWRDGRADTDAEWIAWQVFKAARMPE
jgi:fructose 1,6-bisphosphatase